MERSATPACSGERNPADHKREDSAWMFVVSGSLEVTIDGVNFWII